MLSELMSLSLELILLGLVLPLGCVTFVSLVATILLAFLQIQEQTLLYLLRIISACLACALLFPLWSGKFEQLIILGLDQIVEIGRY